MQIRDVLILSLATSYAMQASGADTSAAAVRAEFQSAYAEVTLTERRADSEALRSYVLYPYLQQQRIQHALVVNNGDLSTIDQDTEAFLKTHGVEPVARELRRVWYASLAKREEWQRYLANYREVDDLALRCHALTARIALQRFEGLASMVSQLWSSAADSLPACESPFTWLKTQSAWVPGLIERRARLALSAGNAAFARQMIALLPKDMTPLLENWAALIEQPRGAIDAAIANPNKVIEAVALLDGWTRLARDNADAAMQRYSALVRARELDESAASRYALEIALPLSWSRRPEALTYFAKVRADDLDDRGAEWYARAAIWNSDWKLTTRIIGSMSDTLRQQTRWRYWLARATALQGDETSAKTQYAALLNDDNYYAALAAARLEKPYAPDQRSIDVNEAQLLSIAAELPFKRARELQLTDLYDLRESAYDEWRFGYNKLGAEARVQAVVLASRWAWHDQAILISAEQRLFNDYRLLYPRAFDDEVNAAAKVTGLSSSIIYATLRQESIFRVDAVSSAGAKGLMQLIPETARITARRWQLAWPGDLFNPRVNIPLGAAHLRDISNRFNNKIPLALAGYNAGPNAVLRWLPAAPKETDIWIENIPFNETRTYVQRVLWHSIVFGWLATNTGQDATSWLTTVSARQN
ncbi:MAG: lytic transglycosylase domain-containing protein [Candidatus Obscuribacterales bacterium]|nr:lytic transglycosylase domain-containing protein [Steroidobacteraceae bacterium]